MPRETACNELGECQVTTGPGSPGHFRVVGDPEIGVLN
jgi:hypothetical protein